MIPYGTDQVGSDDWADDLGSHAIAYARAGLEVLPLVPGGKLPHRLARHGKDSATSDPDVVRDWWVQAPDANVGLRPADGIIVVDVDPRNGGATALAELTGEYGALTPTWTAHTGGGGLHAWFRASGPFRAKLCPGVDLKGHTGYVVAPPSLHPSGKRYSWANALPIAVAPRWLAEAMIQPPRPLPQVTGRWVVGEPGEALVQVVRDAQPGNRNNALHWAARRAAERGSPPGLIERLRAAALAVGLAVHETDRTIASAVTRGGVAA